MPVSPCILSQSSHSTSSCYAPDRSFPRFRSISPGTFADDDRRSEEAVKDLQGPKEAIRGCSSRFGAQGGLLSSLHVTRMPQRGMDVGNSRLAVERFGLWESRKMETALRTWDLSRLYADVAAARWRIWSPKQARDLANSIDPFQSAHLHSLLLVPR